MKPALLAIAVLLCLTSSAAAADYPFRAVKMTKDVALKETQHRAQKESADKSRWPDGARWTIEGCKVLSRYRARCRYSTDHYEYHPLQQRACRTRLVVRIARETHIVSSRVKSRECENL